VVGGGVVESKISVQLYSKLNNEEDFNNEDKLKIRTTVIGLWGMFSFKKFSHLQWYFKFCFILARATSLYKL